MKIAATIARHSMFGRGARLGVAVSGGADSTALLHLLHSLDWSLDLTVLHLNHCLRGSDSDADAAFVEALARRLGHPFLIERIHIDPAAGNLEQEARRARLEFFQRMRAAHRLDRVATAHTSSDQAETVLFRFLRGAGTAGLAGILPVTAEGLVRPLIETTRAEVADFLATHAIEWREDRSNQDLRYRRNRIRHQLLPLLEREWNPNLTTVLTHAAESARDEELYWGGQVALAWNRLTQTHARGVILSSAAASEPRALVRHLIRAAVLAVKGSLKRIDFEHVDSILRMLTPGGPARSRIPGVEATRWRGSVLIAAPFCGYSLNLGQEEVGLPTGEWVRVVLEQTGYNQDSQTGRDALDADRIAGPLSIRNWRPGDAYQPMGYATRQRLNDLFQSARIPCWDRIAWPIVTEGGTIVWTSRFGAAAALTATEATRRVLKVIVRKKV
jgi:tRNA(Ile)-lysidine synthase